jgi:hypothetical protein
MPIACNGEREAMPPLAIGVFFSPVIDFSMASVFAI